MKRHKTFAGLLIFCSMLSTHNTSAKELDAKKILEIIQQSEALRQQAAKLGHEWRDHQSLNEQALSALERKDLRHALALAQRGLRQGQQSVLQAERAARQWRDVVPK